MINYTIEELHKALKDFDDNTLRYENLDIESAYIAIDCIRYCICNKRKNGQPVNQWISVDERLPEDVKIVLVWYTSNTLFGLSEGYGLSWYSPSIGWRKDELNGDNIAIRHWQPLPEPPKED